MKKYNSKIIELFRHLDHAGVLHGEGVKTLALPDLMIELSVQIQKNKIAMARFRCQGSPILLAACEFLCRELEGMSLSDLNQINQDQILGALELSPLHNHVANKLINLIDQLKI